MKEIDYQIKSLQKTVSQTVTRQKGEIAILKNEAIQMRNAFVQLLLIMRLALEISKNKES